MFQIPKAHAVDIKDFFPPATNFSDLASLINVIIPNILIAAGVVFFVIIVYAGIQMIAAGSLEAQKWEKVRNTLTAAVVGLVIVVVAYWIVQIIATVTGINITNPSTNL